MRYGNVSTDMRRRDTYRQTRPGMLSPIEIDAPNCLYASTARSAVPSPELTSELQVEVLVVGGGYTGLSTALHLAEQGSSVALLEAQEPGFGAPGRNGGDADTGFKV